MLVAESDKCSTQFLVGLAFSGAFISALFPFPGLTLVPYLPFLVFFVLRKHDFEKIKIPKSIFLLFFASLYYVFWLAIEPGEYSRNLIVRLVYFYAMAFAFVFGRVVDDPQDFMRGFWRFLLPLSVMSACLGIAKVAFQSRGYILGPLDFFYQMAGIRYPYGSSLIVDYNIYAASLMVAMIGFFLRINRSRDKVDIWSVAAVTAIVLNIYMCGSRRAYALFIVLYMALCFFVVVRKNKKSIFDFFSISFLVFLVVPILSDILISSVEVSRYIVIFPMDSAFNFLGGGIFTYRPQDLISSMSSDQSFGLASRIVRWKFAFDLLGNEGWLFGNGFSYQDKYSCEFSGCGAIDYPHNVFLSEWLLAGILGVVTMLVLFGMIVFEVVRCRKKAISSGVFLILFVVLPGVLISGDGVFLCRRC